MGTGRAPQARKKKVHNFRVYLTKVAPIHVLGHTWLCTYLVLCTVLTGQKRVNFLENRQLQLALCTVFHELSFARKISKKFLKFVDSIVALNALILKEKVIKVWLQMYIFLVSMSKYRYRHKIFLF